MILGITVRSNLDYYFVKKRYLDFFKDFNVIANIQEIPKNMLQKVYISFTQPSDQPHNEEKVKEIISGDFCGIPSAELPF